MENNPRHEFTFRAAIAGVLIGVLFGAANAYLGLKVGLTVSASIPAAVMSVALFRALGRFKTRPADILENNMVQTIGSAGESLAAGVIFTVPALILLGFSPDVIAIFSFGSLGGLLGVLFMVPLRRYLIVREKDTLTYPEGTACASVLTAGQKGGARGGLVFAGLGVGAVFEFFVNGMKLWKDTPSFRVPRFPGAEASAEVSPALLGVGFVIGPRIAAIMFAGGALSWLVIIPAIKFFGSLGTEAIFPAALPIAELTPREVWHNYVRYIGAGAVAFGGFVTLVKSLPVILSSGSAALRGMLGSRGEGQAERTDRDLPAAAVAGGAVFLVVLMALLPARMSPSGLWPSILAAVFAFFFVAVSSRIVGLIGSSSNPISGMTIAALLATALLFKLFGFAGEAGQSAALAVGAIVCIAAAIAGDTSQDLKTGNLVGATPWRQQTGELIGVLTSAAVVGFVVLRLHEAYGIGSAALPAPQATLMSMVVKGVFGGNLPWTLVIIGMVIAAVIELLGIPALPFAVGLYLPLSLSTPIMLGGVARALVDRATRGEPAAGEELPPEGAERGVLFASGLIAGSAFIGMGIGLLRSVSENAAASGCLSERGAGCLLEMPLGTLAEIARRAPEAVMVGPDWAGAMAEPTAFAALFALGLGLYLVARGRGTG